MAHDAQTISMSPVATAVASAIVEMGGGHPCYASPRVVVSALLEALWNLYSNAAVMGDAPQRATGQA